MRALFAPLLLIGFLVKFWWCILLVLGIVVLGVLFWMWSNRLADRDDAERAQRAALIARADQQHAWVLAGDERGVIRRLPAPCVGVKPITAPSTRHRLGPAERSRRACRHLPVPRLMLEYCGHKSLIAMFTNALPSLSVGYASGKLSLNPWTVSS